MFSECPELGELAYQIISISLLFTTTTLLGT